MILTGNAAHDSGNVTFVARLHGVVLVLSRTLSSQLQYLPHGGRCLCEDK